VCGYPGSARKICKGRKVEGNENLEYFKLHFTSVKLSII
jgi:hypothetical protein